MTIYDKFITHQLHKCYKVYRDDIEFKTKNRKKIQRKDKPEISFFKK